MSSHKVNQESFELFTVCAPGLEAVLTDELRELGYKSLRGQTGGVTLQGTWEDVWRINLSSRIATRVLVRFASFRAMHLAQLDKRAQKVEWAAIFPKNMRVKVEATTHKSRIYHKRAAGQRIENALKTQIDAVIDPDAEIVVKLRIDDDLCTISIDSTGVSLHKRGFKDYVGKAALRETLAAGILRQMGYQGDVPVVDPMCGSGSFILEAADIACNHFPGRSRHFAFMEFANFDEGTWLNLKNGGAPRATTLKFYGFDRDDGAIRGATKNATEAGLSMLCQFKLQAISALIPPCGETGIVVVNPPYGQRIGERKKLYGLYGAMGKVFAENFKGWRVGIVTSDTSLAHATNLSFSEVSGDIDNGGIRVKLYQTAPLA